MWGPSDELKRNQDKNQVMQDGFEGIYRFGQEIMNTVKKQQANTQPKKKEEKKEEEKTVIQDGDVQKMMTNNHLNREIKK